MNAPTSPETPRASSLQQVVSRRSDSDFCAGDARVACPLFQAEYGGSKPTSALHLKIARMPGEMAIALNRRWHSRLPDCGNWRQCEAYGAECRNIWYAVAFWSTPVARALNGTGRWELRRMAIAPDAPKNTGSRMLRIMAMLIKRTKPEVKTLVSYQDTEVHTGCIYNAAGWKVVRVSGGDDWTRPNRIRNASQTSAPKKRWELAIRESANAGDERADGENRESQH